MPCHAIAMPCHAMPCHAMPCHVLYAVLVLGAAKTSAWNNDIGAVAAWPLLRFHDHPKLIARPESGFPIGNMASVILAIRIFIAT